MKFINTAQTKTSKPAAYFIQPKLKIGQPDDAYEKEADAIAEQVVNTPQALAQPKEMEISHALQRQAEEEEEEVQTKLQRQAMEEEEEELQTKPQPWIQSQQSSAPATVESEIKSRASGGSPLPRETRSFMENQIGADFSKVKIHTDGTAAQLSESLAAQAFTVDNHVFFNSHKYKPDTREGQQLLAHELTHTVQQGAAKPKLQRKKIPYRQLKWSDFFKEMDADKSHDAYTSAGLNQSMGENLIKWGYAPYSLKNGSGETEVSIKYNPSEVGLKPYMEQEESAKKKWLTDDEAAKKKLGTADISKARAELLKHEQLHFKIAKQVAGTNDSKLKAEVPTQAYKEKITITGTEDADKQAKAIFDKKAGELKTSLATAYNSAFAEMDAVQDIYDVETDHSQMEQQQKKWQDDFDKKFKEAKKNAAKNQAPPKQHEQHEE